MSIESKYQLFISSLGIEYDLNDIDFFGMNIDSHGNIRFKVYVTQEKSHIQDNLFYQFLKSKNMIRYYESVADSTKPEEFRNDFGLQNRTDDNIHDLFKYIQTNAQISPSQVQLAKSIAKIKTTDKKGFNYSSLYFVSVEMSDTIITKSKFHYYTRFCREPDVLSYNSFYRDDEYLRFIKELKIDSFTEIAALAEQIIEIPETHLWMLGYDAGFNSNKYKIYIRLSEKFDLKYISSFISNNFEEVSQWTQNHAEYWMHGLALCTDDGGNRSVNLYFLPSS